MAVAGFASVENYAIARPSYPDEVVSYALEQARKSESEKIRVLDLAAGTGKFTSLLAAKPNTEVAACEPSEGMITQLLAHLKEKQLSVKVYHGTAQSIPVPDESFESVCVAQAFHWFDNIESLEEISRVLVPGGSLTCLWNLESAREPWVAELRELYEVYDESIPQYRKGTWRNVFKTPKALTLFSPGNSKFFNHSQNTTPDKIWLRVLSKSYINVLSADEQNALKRKVEDLLEKYNLNNKQCIEIPLETEVYTAKK